MVSPAGSSSVNCFYNNDTLNGANPNLGAEWIELYNTDPCHPADISCFIIGCETSSGTGQNWGDFHFPGGTVIPPGGHILVGGSNVTAADFMLTSNNSLHCSSIKWSLNDSAGWIGLYNNASLPVDAVYWNIGGSAADLNMLPEYITDLEVNLNYCTCCSPGVLPCVSNGSVAEFGGNIIPGSSMTLSRQTDGSPVWVSGPVGGTPDTCNGGNSNCYSAQIELDPFPPLCLGGSNGSISATVNTTAFPQSPYTYNWSNGDSTQSINGVGSGMYYITITDKWGCAYFADTMLIDPVPPVLSIISNSPVCPGDYLLLSSDIGGISYSWTGPDNFTSSFPDPAVADFQQNNTGYYFLTMVDSNSCVLQDTLLVQIDILPIVNLGNDTTICAQAQINYSIDNGSVYFYLWSDGSTEPQYTVSGISAFPGTNPFWVWASATGCKTVTDSVLVNIEYCEIQESNVMTPNNDNINDVFKINGLEKFPGSELFIFNRWGKLVFESLDYKNNWEAETCPDGVYYYILRIPDAAGISEINGFITVIGSKH